MQTTLHVCCALKGTLPLRRGSLVVAGYPLMPLMCAQLGRGSLVATHDFQGDFLIVIGTEGGCKFPQGSCNIDFNFPELFLDGSHAASGTSFFD